MAWLTVRTSDLVLSGAAAREYASSPGVVRTFCSICGTPLSYRNARRPGETDITVCSLDDPSAVPPLDHIWMQDAPGWDVPADGLPRHPQGRE